MPTLALYLRKQCHLCEAAQQVLAPLLRERGLPLALHDIDDPATDPILRAHYDHAVPVLHLDGREIARHRIDSATVATALDWASTTVCVLAKYPAPGKVKTRLTQGPGAVSPAQAAEVHRLFLLHLLTRLAAMHPARLVLAFDPPDAQDAFRRLLSSHLGPRASDVALLPQSPGDLGTRLATAHSQLATPNSQLVFLGSDAPDLPDAHLDAAVSILRISDAVIGPTPDGGYWTLGVRGRVPLGDLLHSIPWSSGSEYTATLEAFASGRYRVSPLGTWEDVDHPPDLLRLIERLAGAPDPPSKGLHAALTQLLRDPA